MMSGALADEWSSCMMRRGVELLMMNDERSAFMMSGVYA